MTALQRKEPDRVPLMELEVEEIPYDQRLKDSKARKQ